MNVQELKTKYIIDRDFTRVAGEQEMGVHRILIGSKTSGKKISESSKNRLKRLAVNAAFTRLDAINYSKNIKEWIDKIKELKTFISSNKNKQEMKSDVETALKNVSELEKKIASVKKEVETQKKRGLRKAPSSDRFYKNFGTFGNSKQQFVKNMNKHYSLNEL